MIKNTFILQAILCLFVLANAADYPPNIDYGQQGDFITKRGVEQGRAAIIMPVGPVLITQPEGPGSSSSGLGDRLDRKNVWYDLSDVTNPQVIEQTYCPQGCASSPIQAHATIVGIWEDKALLWEPTGHPTHWTWFDPEESTSALQMKKESVDLFTYGRPTWYGSLTSPYAMQIYWSYGERPEGDYYLRDPRFADGTPETGGGRFWGPIVTEWDHFDVTGVSGFPIWMGHLLIYASDQLQSGMAIYDMTGHKNGAKPELLSVFKPVLNKPEPNNGIDEGLGGYWFEPYGTNRVVFAARNVTNPVKREFPSMFIVNVEDPRNPFLSCELYFDQSNSPEDGDITSNPQYVHFQDGYAFVDHFRVDIEACENAYAGDKKVVQSDDPAIDEFYDVVYRYPDTTHHCDSSQYYRPLGQVGVFGGYNDSNTKMTIEHTGAPLPLHIQISSSGEDSVGGRAIAHQGQTPEGNQVVGWFGTKEKVGNVLTTRDGLGPRVITYAGVDERTNEQGLCFVVMHDEPDTNAPYVSGHMPRANATNVPIDTFIHLHIPETLRTETLPGAITVRNNNTNELVMGRQQLSHTGTISIWPDENLDINTTYTVSVSGIRDFMGNTIADTSFNFSTGGAIALPSPTPPPDTSDDLAPTIGSPDFPGTPYFPNQSSQLSCLAESDVGNIWAVNPDNHSVAVVDTTINSSFDLEVGDARDQIFVNYGSPTSITYLQSHYAVTFRDDDRVVFFNAETQQPDFSVYTGYGSQPISSVVDDELESLYVALYGDGQLIKLDVTGLSAKRVFQVGAALELGPTPKAMTLHGDRLLITRYISAVDHGQVYDVDVRSMRLMRTIRLNKVTVSDDLDHGSGVPNFLSAIVVTPDGTMAYVAASKSNTDNDELDDDNTVRPMMAMLDLNTGLDINEGDTANREKTIDFDNAADPSSVTILPDGNSLLTLFQGNNRAFVQKLDNRSIPTAFNTGGAPQSLCTTERMVYIKNFTERSITVIDTSKYMYDGRTSANVATIDKLVSDESELLSSEELAGLQTFYHSSVPQMGDEGYMSCASCHQDGGQDGRVWNLVGLGEGKRNTLSLNGTSGMRFGNLHWSQNFDEIQDFEMQMEGLNKGDGLIAGTTFARGDNPLTKVTSFESTELDNLAAYISSLGQSTVKKSPYRDSNSGELNNSAEQGQLTFNTLGCATCHRGDAFRDGLAHDVGTIDPNDNQAYSQVGGFTQVRTPTLIDLFETAPYLHNGSAATLRDVFDRGGAHEVPEQQRANLIEFLYSIDQRMFIEDDATFIAGSE